MSTAAQLYMTLHRLATAAEAPDTATRTQGISRNELLTLLGISTRANGSLSEAQERAFERAKQTLRDAGARITHVTTDLGERYRLETSDAAKLPAWNPTAEEFRLINTILRGWEGTELQDDAYRILRNQTLLNQTLLIRVPRLPLPASVTATPPSSSCCAPSPTCTAARSRIPAPGAKSTSVTAIMSLMPSSTCSWVCTVPTAGRAPTVKSPCR